MKTDEKTLQIYLDNLHKIVEESFKFKAVKEMPVKWIEENMYIPSSASNISGFASYDHTPYIKELIDSMHSSDPTEQIAIMKCAQSGFTTMLVVAGIIYTIVEDPSPMFFMAETDIMAKGTISDRLEPILHESGFGDYIKSHVEKKKNKSTGDTALKKYFAGGSLTISGASPGRMRQFSVKKIFADDLDAAPLADKKEGSIVELLRKRTTSFGKNKKIYLISTPTVKGASNIEHEYLKGDQRQLNWKCPSCNEYTPINFRIEREDKTFAGIKYELDGNNDLIPESIHYECLHCKGAIYESQKIVLNRTAKWIPTAKPERPNYKSYQLNALVIPSSFDGWETIVREWLEACPPGKEPIQSKLKVFLNTRLGQTHKEKGKAVKATTLMKNIGKYNIGTIPNVTSLDNGNRNIVLISLAVDLGGIMEEGNEDVRADWEIIAHTTKGVTYSIDHGSIGNFKRSGERTKHDKLNYSSLDKWTYTHNVKNSVWDELERIINTPIISESGAEYEINITLIDTGFFEKDAFTFINNARENGLLVVGIKGSGKEKMTRIDDNKTMFNRSKNVNNLYLLHVNKIKDRLHQNMKLKVGNDGSQDSGFMNFPCATDNKYTYKDYFKHFEGEQKTISKNENGDIIGFVWEKKHSSVVNHFWDVYVYNLIAPYIYMDMIKRFDPSYAKVSWEEYCLMLEE